MKKAIKITLTTMVIMCMMLGAMYWFKNHQEEKRLIRQEQERMAEYTIENFEDIKKIEFTSFEQNFSTRSWTTHITINDNIYVKYRVDDIGKNRDIDIAYYIEESGGKRIERKKDKKKSNSNVEVKYWKGQYMIRDNEYKHLS